MGYSSAVVTAKGQELMEKVLAGESKITFTKVGTSEKAYAEYEEKQSLVPNIEKDAEDNVCKIKCVAVFSNTGLTEGYYINTIGLYAKGDDGEEIMFSYIETDGTGKYMEAYNSQHPQSIQFTIYTGLTVNDSSSVIIDPEGVATIKYVDSQLDNVGKRLACDYIEKTETTLNTNHPASKNEVGKKAYVKDTNTVYKCIYDESSKTYKWVVDSSADNVIIASKDYVVEQSNATLTSAKSYSNTNLTTAKTYSDTKLTEAKSYSDTKLTEAKNYSNTNLATAKTYSDTNLKTAKSYSDTNLATAKTYTDNNIPKLYNGSTSSKISNHKGVIIVSGTTAPTTTTCALGYSYETYSS